MAQDFPNVLSCTYGTSQFNLTDYEVRAEAITAPNLGRLATRVRVEADGYVTGASPADLTTKLSAFYTDVQTDGRDFIITGLAGNAEFSLLAAQCLNGGPHLDFRVVRDRPGPLIFPVKIIVNTEQLSSSQALNSYRVTIQQRPDTLKIITFDGEVLWTDGPGFFFTNVLPIFQAAYPPPNWVIQFEYQTVRADLATQFMGQLNYRVEARQLYGALPATPGNAIVAVDGTASKRIDVDEQQRKTTVYDFDLLVEGDAIQLASQLRPTGIVLRSSMQVETIGRTASVPASRRSPAGAATH